MYNANLSYEENYVRGPDASLQPDGVFPKIAFSEAPRFEFLGKRLHLPLGIPAGPLLNAAYVKVALEAGFCLPVYKTVRSRSWPCHAFPNVMSIRAQGENLCAGETISVTANLFSAADYANHRNLSISNSFGVPSRTPDVWLQDFAQLRPNQGQSAVLSFQGSRSETDDSFSALVDDACATAVLAAKAAGSVSTEESILEINLSCPNEKGAPLYLDRNASIKLLQEVRGALSSFKATRLIAKIGPLEAQSLLPFVKGVAGVVDAISAINTVSARIVDENGRAALGSGAETGGVCGRLIFEQGRATIAALADARQRLGISPSTLGLVGVGGVFGVGEFMAYLAAGADLVQSATGAMWNLGLAQEIAVRLDVKTKRDSYEQN